LTSAKMNKPGTLALCFAAFLAPWSALQTADASQPPGKPNSVSILIDDEALKCIRQNQDHPCFLYFPHTAVRVPIHPGDKFKGHSANGPYGDRVEELDWSVGVVMDMLRKLELADNTLVFFGNDNGPWLGLGDNCGSAGPLRGGKFSTFEGGVPEPAIARWPGRVFVRPITSPNPPDFGYQVARRQLTKSSP